MRHSFRFATMLAGMMAAVPHAAGAHVVLSQTRFEAGANFAAFFKVEHGCNGSPTILLKVEIPDGVIVMDTPGKPGWTMDVERVPLAKPVATTRGEFTERVTSVTWRGRLEAKAADQFGVFVKLPARTGPLYFPALQQCEKGENLWNEVPGPNRTRRDLSRPAPVVELLAGSH